MHKNIVLKDLCMLKEKERTANAIGIEVLSGVDIVAERPEWLGIVFCEAGLCVVL